MKTLFTVIIHSNLPVRFDFYYHIFLIVFKLRITKYELLLVDFSWVSRNDGVVLFITQVLNLGCVCERKIL